MGRQTGQMPSTWLEVPFKTQLLPEPRCSPLLLSSRPCALTLPLPEPASPPPGRTGFLTSISRTLPQKASSTEKYPLLGGLLLLLFLPFLLLRKTSSSSSSFPGRLPLPPPPPFPQEGLPLLLFFLLRKASSSPSSSPSSGRPPPPPPLPPP